MTPSSRNKSIAAYVVLYAVTLSALVLDIQGGGVVFTLLGLLGSLLLGTLLVHRMAREMALDTTATVSAGAAACPG